MTDRHIHCVYFQYKDPNNPKGYCLLKCKDIEMGFKPHCEDYVLRPTEVLSYFLKHNNYCDTWQYADKTAIEYIKKIGFNDYPKVIECMKK